MTRPELPNIALSNPHYIIPKKNISTFFGHSSVEAHVIHSPISFSLSAEALDPIREKTHGKDCGSSSQHAGQHDLGTGGTAWQGMAAWLLGVPQSHGTHGFVILTVAIGGYSGNFTLNFRYKSTSLWNMDIEIVDSSIENGNFP